MTRIASIVFVVFVSTGCDMHEEQLSSQTDAALNHNHLSMHALTGNSDALHSMSQNRLAVDSNGAPSFTLDTAISGGIEGTEDGRALLGYVAECALGDGEQLTVAGTTYVFPGLLGLAPRWVDRALKNKEKERLSACLLAHVNAFGVSIPISLRSPELSASSDEIADHQVHEATFFGNVFKPAMPMYACLGDPADQAMAASAYRPFRVCADADAAGSTVSQCTTDVSKPVHAIGRCADVCSQYTADEGWTHCKPTTGPGASTNYKRTMNVWLQQTDD